MAGIYVHIPYCKSFCIYCDFYSELSCAESSESFLTSFGEECSARSAEAVRAGTIKTLYLGGGTPSLLSLDMLRRIFSSLRASFDLSALEEVTIEVNPDDISSKGKSWLAGLKELGVNRISMGVQSFDDRILKWMNRRHDSAEALEAYMMLRDAGFDNVGIDLIFGFSGLGTDTWRHTLETVVSLAPLPPEHISAYGMSLEPGSLLSSLYDKGDYVEPEDSEIAGQYSLLQDVLSEAGYLQYEVSNFSLPGKHSRHNTSYWEGVPYMGLGPSAHSLSLLPDGRRMRSWNVPDLGKYIAGERCGGREILTFDEMREEDLMLGLRWAGGAEVPVSAAAPLVREGLLAPLPGGRYRIPPEKFFISEYIIRKLL